MKFDGQKLRELREAKGWSQEDLAAMVDTSRVSISQWESGKHEPALETIGKLGEAFSVKGGYFIKEG